MSVIVHRCSCGHPDIYHQDPRNPGSGCSAGHCAIPTRGRHDYGPPEVIPTFNDGKVITSVTKPGGTAFYTGPGQHGVALCDCGDCLALYAQQAGR